MILFMSRKRLQEIIDQRAHRMVLAEEKCREFEDILKEMHREVMEGKSVEEYMRTAPSLRDILGMPFPNLHEAFRDQRFRMSQTKTLSLLSKTKVEAEAWGRRMKEGTVKHAGSSPPPTTQKANIKPPPQGKPLMGQRISCCRDPWTSDPDFPVEDWQAEVASNDTRLGYLDWVAHQEESRADHVGAGGEITYREFLDANRTSFECFDALWRRMPFPIMVEFAEKMYNTSSAFQLLCKRLATHMIEDEAELLNRCLRILKAAKHEFAPHTTNSDADELIAELERRLSPDGNTEEECPENTE